MNPFLQKLGGALIVASVVLSACSKQDSAPAQPDQPQEGAKVSYEIAAEHPVQNFTVSGEASERLAAISNEPSLARTTATLTITFTELKARLRQLEFYAKKGDDEFWAKSKLDWTIDLLKLPSWIADIRIPKGTYQKVKVSVLLSGDEAKPAAVIAGKITWNGKEFPLEIQLAGDIKLSANGKDIVVTDDSIDWKGKLKVDFDLMMTKLQVGDFTGSFKDGKLVITLNLNSGAHDKIKSSLESSMTVDHVHD